MRLVSNHDLAQLNVGANTLRVESIVNNLNGNFGVMRVAYYRLGEQVYFYGQPLTVYGRLGRTGVGTYDNAFFMTFDTADALARGSQSRPGVVSLRLEPGRYSALLLQLELDATPEAVRFAIARSPEVKVVAGAAL